MEQDMLIKQGKLSVAMFLSGLLLGITAYVLFFIGNGAVVNRSFSTTSLVLGSVGCLPLLVSAHAENGFLRMFTSALLVAMGVIITLASLSLV